MSFQRCSVILRTPPHSGIQEGNAGILHTHTPAE